MSSYVNDELYSQLRAFMRDSSGLGQSDSGSLRSDVELLLFQEARLLDDRRYADWLDLLTVESVYWIPLNPLDDPATSWALAFDDRRRIEDRIAWLGTEKVHGQIPVSQTQRSLANIEVWKINEKICRTRCTFICHEYRPDKHRHWSGRLDYRLERSPGPSTGGVNWQIAWKVVTLIDAEGPQENLTVIL